MHGTTNIKLSNMFRPPEMTGLNYIQFSLSISAAELNLCSFLSFTEDVARWSLCFLVQWLLGRTQKLRTAGCRITSIESCTSKYNKNIRYLTYRCLQICWGFGRSVVTVYIVYICIHSVCVLYTARDLNIKLHFSQIFRKFLFIAYLNCGENLKLKRRL